MSPYTLTIRTSLKLQTKHYAHLYDAKNCMSNDFLRMTESILPVKKHEEYNVFVSLPSGVRINVAASAFNPTTMLEVANIIRFAAYSPFYENEGKNKLVVHLRHLNNIDDDILFTLFYNPEADE